MDDLDRLSQFILDAFPSSFLTMITRILEVLVQAPLRWIRLKHLFPAQLLLSCGLGTLLTPTAQKKESYFVVEGKKKSGSLVFAF